MKNFDYSDMDYNKKIGKLRFIIYGLICFICLIFTFSSGMFNNIFYFICLPIYFTFFCFCSYGEIINYVDDGFPPGVTAIFILFILPLPLLAWYFKLSGLN